MRYTGIMTLTRFGFNIPSFTATDLGAIAEAWMVLRDNFATSS